MKSGGIGIIKPKDHSKDFPVQLFDHSSDKVRKKHSTTSSNPQPGQLAWLSNMQNHPISSSFSLLLGNTGKKKELLTKIFVAIGSGNVNSLRKVLNAGGKNYINSVSEDSCIYGLTPLTAATAMGNVAMVKLLLQMGADVDFKNTKLKPVYISGKNVLCAKKHSRYNGHTALMIAAAHNKVQIAKLLLKNHAGVEERVSAGFPDQDVTALHFAVRAGNYEMVKLLIQKKANVNDRKPDLPLNHAVNEGKLNIVALLIKNGARVNNSNLVGISPLAIAAKKGYEFILKYLLKKGARKSINVGDNRNGTTPLMTAAAGGHLDAVKILIRNRTLIDKKDKDGETALRYAVKWGRLDIVKYMVSKGADVNAQTKNGCTPFTAAVILEKTSIVRYLLGKGAWPNIRFKRGITYTYPRCSGPLGTAAAQGNFDIAKMLLQSGARIADRDPHFQTTPLMDAAMRPGKYDIKWQNSSDPKLRAKWQQLEWNKMKIAALLIERGLDPRAKSAPWRDGKARTASEIATDCKFYWLATGLWLAEHLANLIDNSSSK